MSTGFSFPPIDRQCCLLFDFLSILLLLFFFEWIVCCLSAQLTCVVFDFLDIELLSGSPEILGGFCWKDVEGWRIWLELN